MSEAKRKVDLVTLEVPSTSNKKSKSDNHENGNVNPYENYSLYADASGEQKVVNEYVKSYIDVLVSTLSKHASISKFTSKVDMFITTVEQIKEKKPQFLTHKTFKLLLEATIRDIQGVASAEDIIDHSFNLQVELQRYLKPSGQKVNDKKQQLTQGQLEEKAKKLTEQIGKIQNMISKLENQPVSLDDMDGETVFTKLPKLKNLNVKLWMQRETLLNRSVDFTGRHLFKGFTYKGTDNDEMNKIVQAYFLKYLEKVKHTENKFFASKPKSGSKKKSKCQGKFEFFTIIDLKKYLSGEIDKSKIDYTLTDETLTKIYKDLLTEHKNRRMADQFDSFRTVGQLTDLKPETFADEKDPDLIRQMDENAEAGTNELDMLLKKFSEKDYKKNGPMNESIFKSLGHDDTGSESDSADEEEDSDDEEGGVAEGDIEEAILSVDEINGADIE